MRSMCCLGFGANYASRKEDKVARWCTCCSSSTYVPSNSTTSNANAFCKFALIAIGAIFFSCLQCCRFLEYSRFGLYLRLMLLLFLLKILMWAWLILLFERLIIVIENWSWRLTVTLPSLGLQVLYHVLGCVPSYHARIIPLLTELCEGLEPEDLAEVLHWYFLLLHGLSIFFTGIPFASIRVILTCMTTVVLILRPSMVCTRSLSSCVLHA
jgi:hypothetical protein